MAATDADLIGESLSNGERFLEVVERHFSQISRYLRRRVGRDLADDLVADVFATAFTRRATYDLGRADALPWLYGIAVNHLRNARRTELRELKAIAASESASQAFFDTPFRSATQFEPGLAWALAELRHDEREVLLLHAWADLNHAEIAEALALPVGTVKSRLSRARSHMRRALATDLNYMEASHG